ncbi:LiaF transmembrane domain-containing protein [Companilactobacillus sp. HBUAS59699]|uniref:LiaF transmembrane domain-containing protein n=1 Tax=Companilactobacillus sp. HBUAS59699 TaxID=3109358 RepID=UPI002FEF8616
MKNRNGIFWGLFMLLSAGILVVSQLHLITYTLSFWTVVATIFLVAILIKSLVYFMIPGTVFSLAFLAILYAKPLGITAIVPWTVLGAALLITIGLSLILRPVLAKYHPWMRYGHHGNNWHNPRMHARFDHNIDVETVDEPDVNVSVKMGNSVRYVTSKNFKQANIDVSMGNAKVYFENVEVDETATINVGVSLGGVELYVPKNWNIVKQIDDNNMSGITEEGIPEVTADSPTVTVHGYSSLAGLKICYI